MVRVEMSGLEPLAFGLRNRRSSKLSYTPEAASTARRRPGRRGQHFTAGLVRAYAIPPGWSALFGVHAVELSIGMHVHP
jgi:hypothetical protein